MVIRQVRTWAEAATALRAGGVRGEPALSVPGVGEPGPRVALIAAKLGRTRLIDNLEF